MLENRRGTLPIQVDLKSSPVHSRQVAAKFVKTCAPEWPTLRPLNGLPPCGFHVARIPLAFHLTYYRSLDDGNGPQAFPSEFDWVNFSFERRF